MSTEVDNFFEVDSAVEQSVDTPSVGHQCVHCTADRLQPSPVKSQSVAVQTVSRQLLADSDKKKDLVPVPRSQLALMRKYYSAVKEAYFTYSLTNGDSEAVITRLFEQTPEVLCAVNQKGCSPIESALAQGNWAAGARLLKLAELKNPRALSNRTASGEDAMMIAIEGASEVTVKQLIDLGYGRNVCLRYNDKGRNSLHQCALGPSAEILQLILRDLAKLLSTGQVTPECVTTALRTSDCDGCTPLHYMARGNQTTMLRAVRELAIGRLPNLDWDVRQSGGHLNRRLTPLAMAAEADAVDACDFLLRSGLAGIDLHEQRELWIQATPSDGARALLGQHCHLLQPLSDLPPDHLIRLQEGLHERSLTEEFLLKLRTYWPDLPPLPMVVAVLAACQNFSGCCRLVVWDILKGMGQEELAQLMEASHD